MDKGFDIFKQALVDANTYITEDVPVPAINDDSEWAKRRTWDNPNVLVVED